MHTKSILATALVAVCAVASAEPDRPKIYFPRQVKRQFGNFSTTRLEPSHPHSTHDHSTRQESSLTSFISLTGPPLSIPGSGSGSGSGSSSSGSSPESDEPTVTTVVITSAIVVPPPTETPLSNSSSVASSPGVGSTGAIPSTIVPPTSRSIASVEPESWSSESSTSTSESTSSILLAPTGIVTTSSADPLAGLSSLLSSVVSDVTSLILPTPNATDPAPTSSDPPTSATSPIPTTTSSTPILSLSIPLTTLLPSDPPTSTPVTNSTSPTDVGSTTPTPSGTIITTESSPTPPPSSVQKSTESSSPTGGSNSTESVTVTPTPPPTSHVTGPTSVIISLNTTSTNGTEVVSTPPPDTTTSSVGLTSLSATATITNSQAWLPTTIIVQATSSTPTEVGLAPTSTAGLPTSLPKAITPGGSDNSPVPDGSTLIQIGFLYGLNYPFVVNNAKSAAQIFSLLPQALSYAVSITADQVEVRKLVPLDTSQSLGYVSTVAVVAFPESLVNALQMDITIPTSLLYNNPDPLVYNLTMIINPAISIVLGSGLGSSASGTGDGSSATATSNPDGGVFSQPTDAPSTPAQKGTTAGIALGSAAVAAAYGTAMFMIARRYKRKKQAHRRSSSITNPSEMRQSGSPALMGGALLSRDFDTYGAFAGAAGGRDSHGSHGTHGTGRSGGDNSVRTAYISAPVAAENSLGWN